MFNWIREKEVLLPTIPNTWKSKYTANADLIQLNGEYLMYYRGTDDSHDRIGVLSCKIKDFDGIHWNDYPSNPIIDVGGINTFDETNILDPSAVVHDKKVFLYYSGISKDKSHIGLAVSEDGYHFNKYESPIIEGRCPEIVVKDNIFHLYFVKVQPWGGYEIFHATSKNGYDFDGKSEVVLHIGDKETWDSFSVTTPRIFQENNLYYMVYAADDKVLDDSYRFGLATSEDLISWTKYSENPIFEKGSSDAWDNSNIWFGTVEKIHGTYWMWYEGCNHRRGYDDFISVVGTAHMKAPYFYINSQKEVK